VAELRQGVARMLAAAIRALPIDAPATNEGEPETGIADQPDPYRWALYAASVDAETRRGSRALALSVVKPSRWRTSVGIVS